MLYLSYVIPTLLVLVISLKSLGICFDLASCSNVSPGTYEHGFVELSTFVFLVFGIAKGIHFLLLHPSALQLRFKLLALFFLFGMFYFAMEEISWGQHLYSWQTTGLFEKYNDQGETNFHNTSSWFDQKPRLLLEIYVLVFGIILPLARQHKSEIKNLNEMKTYFLLPRNLVFVACLAILSKLPERIEDHLISSVIKANYRYSEVQELFFAYFLMLYVFTYYSTRPNELNN